MLVNCTQCNKLFDKQSSEIKRTTNHFCSRSCAATSNNKGKQKNKPKELTCKSCSISYRRIGKHRSESFCVTCAEAYSERSNWYKQLTIGEYRNKLSVKDKHRSWIHAHIRSFNRSWNKELTLKGCQQCGYDKHVELAHIKAISAFGDDAKLSEVNSPTNILSLCPTHHWEFDNGLLTLTEILNQS